MQEKLINDIMIQANLLYSVGLYGIVLLIIIIAIIQVINRIKRKKPSAVMWLIIGIL